jgi:hypothetical protein
MVEHGLMGKPENIDINGCRLILHHTPDVYAAKGVKQLHLIAPEHSKSVSTAACSNALSQAIPPMTFSKEKCKSE